MSTATDPLDRFAPKINFADDGCWLWLGYIRPDGYGSFMDADQRTVMPHRWLFQSTVGPLPAGLQLDHLCRVRHCVNPDHLEAVTPSENTRRGDGPNVWHRRLAGSETGCCPAGHRWTEGNTYYRPSDGFRECRICRRERSAARDYRSYRAQKKAS